MKHLLLTLVLALVGIWGHALPADPRPVTLSQSDGTSVTVRLVGDEWQNCLLTADGLLVGRNALGDVYYKINGVLSSVRAHDERDAVETAFIAANRSALTAADAAQGPERRRVAAPRRVGSTQVPVTGTPRVPVLLVQYADKAMANPVSAFVEQYTQGETSVYQYFVDQSWGQYQPQFDVYGIYSLPENRATYGAHVVRQGKEFSDVGVARMVGDAIDCTGSEVDWSRYDNDNDGKVDVCIVVYAGVGEARGYIDDSVWPCQWSLSSGKYYNDGSGPRIRNGKTIDRFAVFNELYDRDDDGSQLDGIGTFCHEFSHCLGLPDFYETSYRYGYYGMGNWSLMCGGCYNNNTYTPCAYTAYERAFMGWMTLDELTATAAGTRCTLADVDHGRMAYRITNDRNPNEYYVLENIRKSRWNTYAPAEGLMVTHVTYDSLVWAKNKVNDSSMQRMTIIPADGLANDSTETGDLYPWNGNDCLTDDSTPPAAVNTGGRMGKPVTAITQNADGTVSFVFGQTETDRAGDVNADGTVDVNDVNIVINIILELDTAANYDGRANILGTDTVDISDLNALITILLQQ